MPVKKLHSTAQIHLMKRWMACSNVMEIMPDLILRLASGVISNPSTL